MWFLEADKQFSLALDWEAQDDGHLLTYDYLLLGNVTSAEKTTKNQRTLSLASPPLTTHHTRALLSIDLL